MKPMLIACTIIDLDDAQRERRAALARSLLSAVDEVKKLRNGREDCKTG